MAYERQLPGASYDSFKGRVLFSDKKISNKVVVLLAIAGYSATFIFYMLMTLSLTEDLLDTMVWGIMLVAIVAGATLPVVLVRPSPLTIYENGIDRPIPTYRFSEQKNRYLSFDRLKRIHPLYISVSTVSRLGGLTFVSVEEEESDYRDMEENKVKTVKETLMQALKDTWESVYIDTPYLTFNEIQQMRQQLSRSKASVWIEGLGIGALSFAMFIVVTFFFYSFTLIMAFMMVAMFGTLIGVGRITSYYAALANYKKAASKNPDLQKILSASPDIEIDEEDVLKRVEKFTEKDWRGLEKSIHDVRYIYVFAFGFTIMFIGMAVGLALPEDIDYYGYPGITFIGVAIGMSSMVFVPRIQKDIRLVRSLIEKELELEKRFLPEWFEIKHGLPFNLPFRTAPNLSDEEWRRLVRASRLRDQKFLLIVMIVFTFVLLLGVAFIALADLPAYVELPVLFGVAFAPMGYILFMGRGVALLTAIETFEDHSQQKIIPSEFRSQISKSWK